MPAPRHDLEAQYRRYLAAVVLFHQAAADRVGLSATDYQASNLLDLDGPMTNGELARRLRLSSGATTRLVDRLVAEGIAERTTDPADRRKVLVRHTGRLPPGLEHQLDAVRQPLGAAIAGLTASQLKGVWAYLDAATIAYTEAIEA